MSNDETPTPRRRRWAALPLIGVMAATAYAGVSIADIETAHALPSEMVMYTYYSDAEHTNQVGLRIGNTCFGAGGQLYGELGEYVEREVSPCGGTPIPPVTTCYRVTIVCDGGTCDIDPDLTWEISCPGV